LPRGGGAQVNTRHCCQIATRGRDNARQPASRLRRSGEIAGGSFQAPCWFRLAQTPSATLLLSKVHHDSLYSP
jgi:hypothetical protein